MFVDIRLMVLGLILAMMSGAGGGMFYAGTKSADHVNLYLQECSLSGTMKSYMKETASFRGENSCTGPTKKQPAKKRKK